MRMRLAKVLLIPAIASALIAGCSASRPAAVEPQANPPAPANPQIKIIGTLQETGHEFKGRVYVVGLKNTGEKSEPDITIDKKTLEFTTGGSVSPSATISPDGSFEILADETLLQALGKSTLVVDGPSLGPDFLALSYVGNKRSLIEFAPTDATDSVIDLGEPKQLGEGTMVERSQ